MKSQFFYTRKEKVSKPQINGIEQPEEFVERKDSLNLDMVIRTIEYADGGRLVVLNDFHEENRSVPIMNKQGKYTGTKNEKNTYQSEIQLSPEDSARFVEAVSY